MRREMTLASCCLLAALCLHVLFTGATAAKLRVLDHNSPYDGYNARPWYDVNMRPEQQQYNIDTFSIAYREDLAEAVRRLNPGGEAIVLTGASGATNGLQTTDELMQDFLRRQKRQRRRFQRASKGKKNLSDEDGECAGEPSLPVGEVVMVTVNTNDGERTAAVYIPKSYERLHRTRDGRGRKGKTVATTYSPAPLMLLYHGLGDNCERFAANTGFLPFAEKEGFIVASLCGTSGWLGTGWNAGQCCGFTSDKPDELAFTLQLIDALASPAATTVDQRGERRDAAGGATTKQERKRKQKRLRTGGNGANVCLNREKIMAVGFSNGAMLGEVLACRAPRVIRAVGSVGGVTEPRPGGTEGLEVCSRDIVVNNTKKPARPSVLMVHGDADIKVPWTGSWFLGFPSQPENLQGWVSRNGCDADHPKTTINTTKFVNAIYSDCIVAGEKRPHKSRSSTGTRMVEMVRVLGGEHLWPERDGFSTTEHIYNFGSTVFGGWN